MRKESTYEKFFHLYLLNMEIVKKILGTAQKNYDSTDDPRVKAMEINVIKQMTESLKTYEDNLLQTKNNYEFTEIFGIFAIKLVTEDINEHYNRPDILSTTNDSFNL
ncbi:MAG: hypothetical protein MRJ93_05150 [Nitrososphaeraceae archaeon]|nr:hypothetical protein [Nitrososphaeraceae archaeon]